MKTKHTADILDIPITTLNQKEVIEFIIKRLKSNKKTFLTTPNPEILLESQKNAKLKNILMQTDLNTPDGIGLLWADNFLLKTKNTNSKLYLVFYGIISVLLTPWINKNKLRIKEVVTGTDLMNEICTSGIFNDYKFFFLGGQSDEADSAKKTLQNINKKLKVVGTSNDDPTNENSVDQINESEAEILFVAYGCPKQEIWIYDNLSKLKHIKFVIGIGGAFNFLSGKISRAPRFIRKLGLEWLYRLFKEPLKRSKRIFNAVIVFPYQIIKSRVQKSN
ncbi:WecB/TagA/CpsF family glycosyltransferase [Candidatus Peregrinibacteria bacterium]|nr:WecB/TagA/CpsF family glycosyltransferase [Candidatus Peregrinibacteria bacterium]